jgi:hypothetical protein
MDNGRSLAVRVFQNVMAFLGVRMMTHLPAGKDGRRVTARSKGRLSQSRQLAFSRIVWWQ